MAGDSLWQVISPTMALLYAHEAFTSVDAVRESNNCGCVTSDEPTDEELLLITEQASDILAQMTQGRYLGRATVKIRPCREGCWDACPCCDLDGVPLWGPDPVVTQVKIDGVVLDPTSYTIHQTRSTWRLVRVAVGQRPDSWPSWQTLWQPDTETQTFSITFTYGPRVDWLVEQAAIELSCYFANVDHKKKNALPKGTVSMNYNSTSVSLEERRLTLRGGANADSVSVGEQMSAFLALYAQPRSTFWAPELAEGWTIHVVGS